MKNKRLIQEKLMSLGLRLGCYDLKIDKLSKENLEDVLENMEFGSTDIGVKLDKKECIVEVFHVDNEVDLNLVTTRDYAKTYGRIFNK